MKKMKEYRNQKGNYLFFPELRDVKTIEKILSIFNFEYIFGLCWLEKEDDIEADWIEKNDVKLLLVENKKYKQLFIMIPKSCLKEFINITEKFETCLEGCFGKREDWEYFLTNRQVKECNVYFILNDNNGSCLNFKTDSEEMKEKINQILNGHQANNL